jgi:predicted aspartyl protease
VKKPLGILIAALLCLSPLISNAGAPPAALKSFLQSEGYGGTALQRRLGNHLFATTIINGRRMALAIDTGTPFTLVDAASAKSLGLKVQATNAHITGVTGFVEKAGTANLGTLGMGNCTFVNVPIGVADTRDINLVLGPHLDGLFGLHEMSKFGVIVDCARQMLYVNPNGQSAAKSQKLESFLTGRGFVRIPMRLNAGHHLVIDGKVNRRAARFIVDTGAGTTFLSAPLAYASGAATTGLRLLGHGATGGTVQEKVARIQELTLGDLLVHNAEITIGEPKIDADGLLGEEYLSWNFGIVDVGGMNLYLRPPEPGSRKKR